MAFSLQRSTLVPSQRSTSSKSSRRRTADSENDFEYETSLTIELEVGHIWDNLTTAKEDVKAWILDRGESYKVYRSNKSRMVIECLQKEICKFYIRVSVSKKPGGKCSLVTYVPHTCPPITHQDFSERNSKWYIARNQARSIIQSRRIKPKDIIDNEAVSVIGMVWSDLVLVWSRPPRLGLV